MLRYFEPAPRTPNAGSLAQGIEQVVRAAQVSKEPAMATLKKAKGDPSWIWICAFGTLVFQR